VLFVVEGRHDAEFLRRISRLLHRHDSTLPSLPELEEWGAVLFLESGGDPAHWTTRLAPLRKAELHLFDREGSTDSRLRELAAETINRRPRCRAFVTPKRSLENFLHPEAIREAGNVAVKMSDDDPVPNRIARKVFEASHPDRDWDTLPYRVRRRLRDRAKRWLNTDAVDRMTIDRLRERDPDGEITTWLRTLAVLFDGAV
jgi:hypothetical protein